MDDDLRLIHKDDLKALLADAAALGARRALAGVGLDTPERVEDFRTALAIGRGVREAQKEVWRTVGRALIWAAAIGAVVWLSGLAPKLGAALRDGASLFTTRGNA